MNTTGGEGSGFIPNALPAPAKGNGADTAGNLKITTHRIR